jgi:hypothetical protein
MQPRITPVSGLIAVGADELWRVVVDLTFQPAATL